jgi:hypothetical protein
MIVLLQRVSLNNAYNVNCRAPAAAPAFPLAAALPRAQAAPTSAQAFQSTRTLLHLVLG